MKEKNNKFCGHCAAEEDEQLKEFVKKEKTKAFVGGILVGVTFILSILAAKLMLG